MTVRLSLRAIAALAVILIPCSTLADSAMRVLPPNAELSPQRLERITGYFDNEVATGKIAGAIVMVQRHGKPVYFKSFGQINPATGTPMTPQAIFRIRSMSKPITSVAAMMLIDDSRMKLDDPVSKYIPSFAGVKVGVGRKSANGDPELALVPVERPITVEDLLRHSSGITYGLYGDGPVRDAYKAADLFNGDLDNAAFVEKIARLPLAEQPGTVWDYGHSTDVLGRVIEVVAGTSLYEFEKKRLFEPLGMIATSYYVADPARHDRIAEPVASDNNLRALGVRNPRLFTKWESGGGGLLSTVDDFARFAQMLLNGGELDGRRYLKPESFAAMTTNRIAPATSVRREQYYFPGDGFGFGLGFGVRTEAGHAVPPPPGSLGEIKWDGSGGTYFWIDRAQVMFAILMMQSPIQRGRIHPAFKAMVYDAFAE